MSNKDYESEVEKELQLEIERQKLEDTIKKIKEEIRIYIQKRTNITESLVDARKRALDDYRDDEDKLIEYFDHERYVREETFKSFDRKLRELTILQSAPYFGKVKFKEKGYDEEEVYIGRFGVTQEEAYEPLVVDWRAPIAALFYKGKLGEAEYDAPMGKVPVDILAKRQFIIKRQKLVGMFDSEVDVKDDILQMVLSENASEKLKDIIMTIQEEQDNIIRQSREKSLVVNGIAGSGKTTIALHRVAYLLYNYRKILQDKVLILGPNSIFMEYISTVLPSLGEIGVRQQTFAQFAQDILESVEIISSKEYMDKVINKDKEFIKEILYKTSDMFIAELDKFINTLNEEYFILKDLLFDNNLLVSKVVIEELFEYYKAMPLFRRSAKVKRILFSKIRDERDNRFREIERWYKESLEKMNTEEKNREGSNLSFKRRVKIRELIKKVIEAKVSLSWLDNENCIDLYNGININKCLTIDDLAPILYLKIKLEGLKLQEEIKHVVIDEAQDYSLLQFMVIRELTNSKGYTIVGDKNQRTIPITGEVPMMKLQGVLEQVEYFNLNKSYRSTKEIIEYANKYIGDDKIVPLVRNGKNVSEKSIDSKEFLVEEIGGIVKEMSNEGLESIAVICKNAEITDKVADIIKDKVTVKVIDREDIIYTKGQVILPSYFAKGLEFDGVIVITDEEDSKLNKMMYVMSTRALHQLHVLKTNKSVI